MGTLKATTSDEDKYCMPDSGANVMVVPLMRDMKGDRTMCSLVGDNKTPGLIISRLCSVTVQEDDDLLFLGKNTLWRVGHDT